MVYWYICILVCLGIGIGCKVTADWQSAVVSTKDVTEKSACPDKSGVSNRTHSCNVEHDRKVRSPVPNGMFGQGC